MITDILIKVDLIRKGFEESKQNQNGSAMYRGIQKSVHLVSLLICTNK